MKYFTTFELISESEKEIFNSIYKSTKYFYNAIPKSVKVAFLVGTGIFGNIVYQSLKPKKLEDKICVSYYEDTAPLVQSRKHFDCVTFDELKRIKSNPYVFELDFK